MQKSLFDLIRYQSSQIFAEYGDEIKRTRQFYPSGSIRGQRREEYTGAPDDIGLDLFVLGYLAGIRKERAKRKRRG